MKSTQLVPRIAFLSPPDPTVAAIFAARAARAPAPAPAPPPPSDGLASAEVLPAGSRPSSQHLRICRARPNVSPAGSRGGKPHQIQSSCRRSGYGRPPGYRRKPIHEVDEVLIECDDLAWEAMKPDTS